MVHQELDEETIENREQEKRDEKLKSDIFILKKLNAAFELFHDSLEEAGSANEVGFFLRVFVLFADAVGIPFLFREWLLR